MFYLETELKYSSKAQKMQKENLFVNGKLAGYILDEQLGIGISKVYPVTEFYGCEITRECVAIRWHGYIYMKEFGI